MKFPKLYKAVSDDDLRPAMCVAKVTKEFTYASNAHILVKHLTGKIFKSEFIESLPEGGICIPRKALMQICEKVTLSISLSDDKQKLILNRNGYEIVYKLPSLNYPNAESVIPSKKDCTPVKEITLSTYLLNELSESMGCDPPQLTLYLNDRNGALIAESKYSIDGCTGIIMPCLKPV